MSGQNRFSSDCAIRPVTVSEAKRNYLYSVVGFFACFCYFWVASPGAYGSTRLKTDVVVMKNGDKITCEIRSLGQGQLTIKQSYANSTVALDWTQVDYIETHQPFVVLDSAGISASGVVSEKDGLVSVSGTTREISHDAVVSIEQTGETFLRKIHGSVSVGSTFAQSNSQKNASLDADLTYQGTGRIFGVTSDAQFSSQQKVNNTSEITAKSQYFAQLRKSKWYGGGIANFLSSSEQEIDLRSTIGAAIAVLPILTNKSNLYIIGGLGYTNEKDASNTTSPVNNNGLDGAFAVQFSTFRFDSTNFNSTVWVYPSLTTTGRVRMTINENIYYKFYRDFTIGVSFYDNYDNRPVVGAPANNLGASTTLGWSFR
jgi:hypothetical protein